MGVKKFVEKLRKMMVGSDADYGEIGGFYRELQKHGAETW